MGQLPFHLQSALQKPDAEAQLWQWQVWVPQQNRYHSGSGGGPTCDRTCNQTINVKKNQLITSNNYTSDILIHIYTWTCRMRTMSPKKMKPQARWIINFQGPSRVHWLGSTFCRPLVPACAMHIDSKHLKGVRLVSYAKGQQTGEKQRCNLNWIVIPSQLTNPNAHKQITARNITRMQWTSTQLHHFTIYIPLTIHLGRWPKQQNSRHRIQGRHVSPARSIRACWSRRRWLDLAQNSHRKLIGFLIKDLTY